MKNKELIITILVFVALLIVAKKLFSAVGETAHAFGIGESDKAASIETSNVFSPNYYKGLKKASLLYYADAKAKAQQIDAAIHLGGAYTNDDAIIGVIKNLKNKAQVSQVADLYQKLYGADMVASWSTGMTNHAKEVIADYVKDLPKQ